MCVWRMNATVAHTKPTASRIFDPIRVLALPVQRADLVVGGLSVRANAGNVSVTFAEMTWRKQYLTLACRCLILNASSCSGHVYISSELR